MGSGYHFGDRGHTGGYGWPRLRDIHRKADDYTIGPVSIAIMGEAAKCISPAFKAGYPDIPWRAIAGMRDRIVHEYFRTNTQRIWDVVTSDIDELEKALGKPVDRPPAAD